ncbi:receptor serine/threonine kinase [Dorcoceras hygrometricum]|uniref:Receptor serine/threonine kinase n=1 Tax=Dorcoceras hygrometricum TaxID=472368 RepID=A0A2Z6ZZ62_9LAMI|nr:receptor serine/threonine kinase [Dorcoceras hygrometricum]
MKKEKDIELFLKNHENFAPKRYKYCELKRITNSFKDKLGKGGYGTVYRGVLHDGRLVAVKILDETKDNVDEFMNEVMSISKTSHVNIVTLPGFCFERSKRALIYEFMPNGSFDKFVSDIVSSSEDRLGRETFFEIAVDIARGLQDLNPKISDFGLATLCPNRSSIVSMLVARGTIGYIAPDIFYRNFGEVSCISDVYGYGMMVLEIVGVRQDINNPDAPHTHLGTRGLSSSLKTPTFTTKIGKIARGLARRSGVCPRTHYQFGNVSRGQCLDVVKSPTWVRLSLCK